jgi:hypothetical protein
MPSAGAISARLFPANGQMTLVGVLPDRETASGELGRQSGVHHRQLELSDETDCGTACRWTTARLLATRLLAIRERRMA